MDGDTDGQQQLARQPGPGSAEEVAAAAHVVTEDAQGDQQPGDQQEPGDAVDALRPWSGRRPGIATRFRHA